MIGFDFDLACLSNESLFRSIADNVGSLSEIGLIGDYLDSSFEDGSYFNLAGTEVDACDCLLRWF
jgi:hypothetical protein